MLTKIRKIYFACIIILFSVLLSPPLSYGKAFQNKNSMDTGETIRIAVAVPAEGRFSYYSKQFMNGLLLSLRNADGPKIRYIIINLPVNAGAARVGYVFSYLAKKKISAVVGPIFAGQIEYFAYNSVKFKIPVITPSPVVTSKNTSPFVFSYGMTLKQEIRTEMKYAAYDNIRSVSAIYPDNGYGLKLLGYINRFSKKYGINVLNTTAYRNKTVDFFYNFSSIVRFKKMESGHLSKAEEAQIGITPYNLMHGITKSKPHIPFRGLFVLGNPSKLELILTQLMYYNITGFPIFGLSSLDSRPFIEKYGFYMQNAIFPDGFFKHDENKTVKKFNSAYRKNYGEMPNILSAEGYDIGGIIIKAAETIHNRQASSMSAGYLPSYEQAPPQNPNTKDINASAFYKAVLSVKSFKGVCGASRLTGNRFKKSLYLFKYKNNKIYILESPF
ncbi:MAG: penicillin-binding protein activator [bacterium]